MEWIMEWGSGKWWRRQMSEGGCESLDRSTASLNDREQDDADDGQMQMFKDWGDCVDHNYRTWILRWHRERVNEIRWGEARVWEVRKVIHKRTNHRTWLSVWGDHCWWGIVKSEEKDDCEVIFQEEAQECRGWALKWKIVWKKWIASNEGKNWYNVCLSESTTEKILRRGNDQRVKEF